MKLLIHKTLSLITKTRIRGLDAFRYLNIKLGKNILHILVDRALKCSVEDLPTPEPIEEIMAISTFESFDSVLEEDIEEIPKEVIKAEEDSEETFELTEIEKPSRPLIELKPLPSGLR